MQTLALTKLIVTGGTAATLIVMTFCERKGWITVDEEIVKFCLACTFVGVLLWAILKNPLLPFLF